MSNTDENVEVIPSPATSVTELENGIFTLVITLTNHYMNVMGYPQDVSSQLVADLLERYVDALRANESQ